MKGIDCRPFHNVQDCVAEDSIPKFATHGDISDHSTTEAVADEQKTREFVPIHFTLSEVDHVQEIVAQRIKT